MKSVVCRRRRRAKEVAGLILLADWHVTFLSNNTINKLCTDTGVQVTLFIDFNPLDKRSRLLF